MRLGSAPVDPDEARRIAHGILGSRRFRSAPTPRPLRKPLSWLGDRVSGIFDWFGRVFSHIPSGLLLLLAIAAVVALVVFVVRKILAQRGAPDGRVRAARRNDDDGEDPDELERAAVAAERAGRLEAAVRLRFRAGLLRLGDRGAIRYRPSVTTNEVRRVLGSQTFDELARTFDAIAYGGRDAEPPDVDAARREWPRVVSSAAKGAEKSLD
jgi:Domain of unknown function (DUF4129)